MKLLQWFEFVVNFLNEYSLDNDSCKDRMMIEAVLCIRCIVVPQ